MKITLTYEGADIQRLILADAKLQYPKKECRLCEVIPKVTVSVEIKEMEFFSGRD